MAVHVSTLDRWRTFARSFGPAWVVMIADVDARRIDRFPFILKVVSTPQFQRLRHISQQNAAARKENLTRQKLQF